MTTLFKNIKELIQVRKATCCICFGEGHDDITNH